MNKTTEDTKRLKKLINVQCSDGNWNYDSYMHGLTNGLILALSVLENSKPEFLDPPEVWLKDTQNSKDAISSSCQ